MIKVKYVGWFGKSITKTYKNRETMERYQDRYLSDYHCYRMIWKDGAYIGMESF